MIEIYTAYLKTEKLLLKIETNRHAVKAISFVESEEEPTSDFPPEIIKKTIHQLNYFLDGNLRNFHLPIEPEGTEFQKKVWNLLCKIPFGKTCTYAEMAHQLGDPKVIRAAASANGRNPIAIVIPCHRVIGSDGNLTGYAGGLKNKRFLLDLENRVANGVMELF
jgi:methylated-DNA-[protein]-cysteine S-methyltransferase